MFELFTLVYVFPGPTARDIFTLGTILLGLDGSLQDIQMTSELRPIFDRDPLIDLELLRLAQEECLHLCEHAGESLRSKLIEMANAGSGNIQLRTSVIGPPFR